MSISKPTKIRKPRRKNIAPRRWGLAGRVEHTRIKGRQRRKGRIIHNF